MILCGVYLERLDLSQSTGLVERLRMTQGCFLREVYPEPAEKLEITLVSFLINTSIH
jgi:hypothetical protein